MANISRRGFLVAAAACTAATGLPPADADAAEPQPRTPARPAACIPVDQPPESASASGEQGTVSASVTVTNLTDVVAINYTVANTSAETDIYTIYYTDQVTTQTSAAIQTLLKPGQFFNGLMHGSLNHDFVLTVALSDGTILNLGPVGELPVCGGTSRPYPTPIFAAAPEVKRPAPATSSARSSTRSPGRPSAAHPAPRGSGASLRPPRVLDPQAGPAGLSLTA